MFKNNKISKLQYIFFIFLFSLLFEGYYCKYSSQRTNSEGSICSKYFKDFWVETGFVETFQVVFILSALLLSIYLISKFKNNTERTFLCLISICLFYYFGEEISWGQHYLQFQSPDFFIKTNNQKEFNLHNISNLLDQLPRSVVFMICGFSSIYVILYEKLYKHKIVYRHWVLPDNNLIYVSIALLTVTLPDFVNDKLNLELYNHSVSIWGIHLGNQIYELITFNYIRLSELQELIFSFYFFNYMISLKKKYNY